MTINEFMRQYGNVKFKCCGHDKDHAFMRLDDTLVCVHDYDEMLVEDMPMEQIQPLISRIIELPKTT